MLTLASTILSVNFWMLSSFGSQHSLCTTLRTMLNFSSTLLMVDPGQQLQISSSYSAVGIWIALTSLRRFLVLKGLLSLGRLYILSRKAISLQKSVGVCDLGFTPRVNRLGYLWKRSCIFGRWITRTPEHDR